MKKVRSAEQGLKLRTHKRESYCKTTSSSVASIEDQVPALLEESISDETLQENMCYEEVEIEDEMYEPEDTQEVEDVKPAIEPSPKKSKLRLHSQGGSPDSITYTHFELEHSNENDQNIITLNIRLQTIDRPKDGTFQFELSWIKHFDAAAIYQCRYCVKAFANAEYLLKHTVSSHICLICSRILDNYSKKVNIALREEFPIIIQTFLGSPSQSATCINKMSLLLQELRAFKLPAAPEESTWTAASESYWSCSERMKIKF